MRPFSTRCAALALCLGGTSVPSSQAEGVYRLDAEAAATRSDLQSLHVVLRSAELRGRELWLRAGYRHTGQSAFYGKIAAPTGVVVLEAGDRLLSALEVDARLQQPVIEDGLREGAARMGSLRFDLGTLTPTEILKLDCALTLPPFPALRFRLSEAARSETVNLEALAERTEQIMSLQAAAESLALVRLRATALSVKDGRISFEMESTNESRFAMGWSGGLSLRAMRLRTSEDEMLEPVAVMGGLADRLAPAGEVWPSGARNTGSISFRLPHPHAARQLALVMPGYQPLTLRFDEQSQTFVPDAPETLAPLSAAQAAERRFASLAAFWAEQGRRLQQHDQEGFLRRFNEGTARADMARALAGLVRVPVSWVEFHVPERQQLAGHDLEVKGLLVEMRWLLAGLPRENEFLTRWRCDLSRAAEGQEWKITHRGVEGREAFWERGYTEMISTEHFLLFYQSASADGARRAQSAATQLESARQQLLKTRLPLGPRYAALIIPDKEDFRALSGRDPGTFTGAASVAYGIRDGELRAFNQALYLNDSHFSSLQRRWGRQDRAQTMQHELVHLALAHITRPWTPTWLVEGIATYKAGQLDASSRAALRQQLPQGRVLAHLSSLRTLGENGESAGEVWTQYHYSAAAVRWIERQFGEEKLLALYEAYSRARPLQWQSPAPAADGQETEALKRTRLEIADGVLADTLGGWRLDQVDAATRRDLQR